MNKEQFGRGLQLINAVLPEGKQISSVDTIEAYYLLLKDLDAANYQNGIILLLKEKENIYMTPSPAEIIKYSKMVSVNKSEARDIFVYIRRDIILFGKKIPKYKKRILNAIDSIGGWHRLREATDEEMNKFEKEFILAYEENLDKKMLLENKKQGLLE